MESIKGIKNCSNLHNKQVAQGSANIENSGNTSSIIAAQFQNEKNYEAVGNAGAVEGAKAPSAPADINPVESTSISAEAQDAISGDKGLGCGSAQNSLAVLLAGMLEQGQQAEQAEQGQQAEQAEQGQQAEQEKQLQSR